MLNLVFLVLGAGGAIVSVLALPETVSWKWYVVAFFGVISLLGLGLVVHDWWKNVRSRNLSGKRVAACGLTAKIVLGTDHPFESVEPAGVNRRSIVRVKIQNESDAPILNGTVRITDLDPPAKGDKDFFLKGDISIPAHESIVVDVGYYDIGTSVAAAGRTMRLCVPIGPAYYDQLPGTLPPEQHTFYLEFSTVENRLLAKVYCRLFLDNGILRLVDATASHAAPLTTSLVAHDKKAELIKSARQLVVDATARDGVDTDFRAALEHSVVYLQLRPYLSADFLEKVRNGRLIIVSPDGSDLPGLAHAFLNEIDRIEKQEITAPRMPTKNY
jgi:hypothetical protein